jgi:hypothetical protein
MFVRPPSVLVTDVAFAHVAGQDEHFFGWVKES